MRTERTATQPAGRLPADPPDPSTLPPETRAAILRATAAGRWREALALLFRLET
jgi:hypothetical protein